MDHSSDIIVPDTPSDAASKHTIAWRKLTTGKELCRLLYPNPVCFLCTSTHHTNKYPNVMVLSWLTATNNHGRFMFSIHKRRHTATTLLQQQQPQQTEFVLSVPVHGMETLLCHVGGVSGSWGSKFPAQTAAAAANDELPVLKLQHPKKKKPRFPQGIPGLRAISLAAIDASGTLSDDSGLFGIDGCVAFVVCQIHRIILDNNVIDEDHLLVVADMKVAWVHPEYWCRNQFRPVSDQFPPYLTFLGSQTFGLVVMADDETKTNA